MKLLIALGMLAALPLHASPERVMTVKATVHGMVCSFCAQGIIAHFKKHPAVSDVHVDLDRKLVLLEEKKGASVTDKEIREYIARSGFDLKKIDRVKTAFDEAKKK
ncbi:heavy metal transport/detoxification protein [Haloferula helveola]|uniref:Heavy metal transport/detoxification protein n=1 Tax=Haloferula helveola TaxID=490095 RepID=A0ABN6H2C9_9BACT|nr:heavy metal transport/detoxification protein [Haloferula helveola]